MWISAPCDLLAVKRKMMTSPSVRFWRDDEAEWSVFLFFLVHERKHLKHRHAVWHWRSLCVPRRVASFYQKRSLVFHVEMLFFPFIPLSWENLPELIHPSQRMNFQSGISRIFQCGSSFVNLASVAYVAGKGNVNRIWSLGQCGLPHLFQRKTSKKKKNKAT